MLFSVDDRYVIVKRKNANGSKTPPQYKSTTPKSTNDKESSVQSPTSGYNNFMEGEYHDLIAGMYLKVKNTVCKIQRKLPFLK